MEVTSSFNLSTAYKADFSVNAFRAKINATNINSTFLVDT